MFLANGTRLKMTRGDYGVTVPIRVKSHCGACESNISSDDQIILQVIKGDCVKVSKVVTWKNLQEADGIFQLEFSKEESAALDLGVYAWRLVWYRPGEICHSLLRSVMEVVV